MYAENFYIVLYDEERQMTNWPFIVDTADDDYPDPTVWEPFGTGDSRGMTGVVLRSGTPMLLSLADIEETNRRGEVEVLGTPAVSWLGVPLLADGRTVGAMAVQSYREDVHLTEENKELLTFVANHVGAALSRARAIEETRQRNAELALINDVQRGLAENLEMQAMYDLVGDRLQEIFDAQVVDIADRRRADGQIQFKYTIERGVRFPDEPIERRGLPQACPGDTRTAPDQRGRPRSAGEFGQPAASWASRPSRSCSCRSSSPARPPGHLAPEPGPRTRLQRRRRPAPDDARGQPERRPRERPAVRGDAAAERRARAHQRGPARPRREPRHAGDVRPGRRADPEIFDAQAVDIGVVDRETSTRSGSRTRSSAGTVDRSTRSRSLGSVRIALETREPVVVNEDMEARCTEAGSPLAIAGEPSKSRCSSRSSSVPGHGRDLAAEPRPGARVQ